MGKVVRSIAWHPGEREKNWNILHSVLLLELLEDDWRECSSLLRPSGRVLLLETVEYPGEHVVQLCRWLGPSDNRVTEPEQAL